MPSREEDLLQRLRATFRVEAQEHVQAITSGLIELEGAAPAAAAGVLDVVFRAAHSLKGAARAVNMGAIESLCQSLESVFAALKRQGVVPSAALFDLLHRTVGLLSGLLASLDGAAPPPPAAVSEMRQALWAAHSHSAPAAQPIGEPVTPVEPPARALSDTVRVRRRTLDTVLLQSEELLYAKIAAAQRADALRSMRGLPAVWRARSLHLRADVRSVESALEGGAHPSWMRVRAYLDDSHDFAARLETELLHHARLAEQDQRAVATMVDQLLDQMKQVVVQPFSTLLDLFPPSVRELARDQGKEIELVVEGGHVEIDRRILDELKDPLIHLVRNSVDHGIESPALRRAKGKPQRGRLEITVGVRNGSQVEVTVRDDGAGLDSQALHGAAVKAGVLPQDDASASLAREALLNLAFEPGVSTSPFITDLSGRGLGLSIVKEHVQRLSGSLSVESPPGQGACFHLVLPLTLARFRGVLVRAGRCSFVLPTRGIERVARVPVERVTTVENRETVAIDGRALALVDLAVVLGLLESERAPRAALPVVVLGGGSLGTPIAFAVDEVLDEREVLVKPLARPLVRVRNIAAATVLGTGQVVPILHVPDLLRSAVRAAPPARRDASAAEPSARKSILVAEDSITSRALLKGILENAGYRVETAADGIDAYTALRSREFDLVVSDVDMPRLNGFGLTAKIRADRKLADVPVVLVTALESREDREHGIDVGASAYIVKSNFDQGNLLEVVGRLA